MGRTRAMNKISNTDETSERGNASNTNWQRGRVPMTISGPNACHPRATSKAVAE